MKGINLNNLTEKSRTAVIIYFVTVVIEILIAVGIQSASISFLSSFPYVTLATKWLIIISVIILNVIKLFWLLLFIWSENKWRKIKKKFGKTYR